MTNVKFYDLLGVLNDADAATIWPRSRIKSSTGFSVDADPTDLVHYLQSALEFHVVRPGADTDRVGLSAEVIVNNPPPPLIRPLVLTQMPDIALYLQNTPGTPAMPNYKPARLYITRADSGTELVIEGLPVEIQLPTSLLGPLRTEAEENANPGGGPDITLTDTFQPGIYDSLQVTLRDTNYSSIFVHLKVRMTEEMDFIIEPAVPISIGPCRFNGLPCYGLHDFNLFPSPRLQGDHSEGEQALEWTRHPLDRLSPDAKYSGVLTVRTVDLDSSRAPLKDLAEKMNDGSSPKDRVEFVLEDIALPFSNLANLPIPSHGLFGLRRKIEIGHSPEEAYAFSGAPVQIKLGDWRLLIDQFLLQTPASLNPLDQFIFVQMALLFGSNPDKTHAATFGVTDEWTIQAGWHSPTGLTLFTIADATIKLWGAKVGWSIKRFASKNPHYKWDEQLQLLVDLGLSTKGTTLFGGAFKMRSLSGKDLEVVLRDVGWNLGSFSLEGLSFPEGVQFIAIDVIRLIVEEVGWITENNGGRYFSFSGGVSIFSSAGQANRNPSTGSGSAAINDEKGKGGGIRFRRLRFLTGGNPNAPAWLLDGISLSLKISGFSITGFGMISEFTEAGHEYKEFGFGIQVEFDAIAKHFLIGMQFFYGRVRGPTDNFTYWLFGFQFSPIPIGAVELVNIRMLLAGNMMPNLPPPDGYAQNMRLFRWYKDSGNAAITIPTNRKLAAWIAKDDSFAAGLGAGLSLPVGDAIVLDLFLFFHKSPEESGLLIALEVYVLKSPKPVGYGALEFDFERDKWGFMIGVTLSIDNVLPDISIPILSRLISLTGSLYAGNKPGTFAIGQLNDQATWLSFRFDASAFINTKVLVALCVQLVDMPDGPRGFGLVISGMGGADFGIGKIQVYFAFGLTAGVWRNESKVSGFVIWIEAGLRIKVFWVFNFGASVKVELDYLGPSPTYRRLGCEVRIETPWWLPDVTFRFEKIWEQPKPEELETISSPLTTSGGINPGTRTQENVAVTPLIGTTINEREVYTMNKLRALGDPSLPTGTLEGLTPVGVDSIIALNFKPAVDDNLSVGENTPPGASKQKSNDLTATYELVDIAIRRSPRFGAGAGVWTTLLAPEDTRLENPADFPSGPDLEAHFTSKVSFQWDKDLLKEDRLDPRRLLINAETPYTFLTHNPESDESLGRNEPGWPCCIHEEPQRWHELNFMDTPFGIRAKSYQTFSESSSTLHWIGSMPPIVAPGQTAPAGGWHVARIYFADQGNGVFATISFDQPVIIFEIYAYWFSMESAGAIIVEAYNGLKLVNQQTFLLSLGNQSGPIRLEARDGITSVLLRYKGSIKDGHSGTEFAVITGVDWVEFVEMRYRDLQEELDRIAREQKCKAQGTRALEGGGKLAWLPNHDYEISLTTKVILNHVKTGSQEARIKQKAFFRTKGLPGLNAVARIGDELEPYVESRYPGFAPRTLYRIEPVALAFNEKFNILLPIDRVPSPDNPAELNQLLEWVLAIDKAGDATGGERISQTSPDWVVAHRIIPLPLPTRKAVVIDSTIVRPIIREAVTRDPFQMRFETMLHRPTGCNVPGPSLHRSQVLFHEPVDPSAGPSDPQRWEPNSVFRVNVRRKDGPFVERNPFDDNDYTAFDMANEGGGVGSDWSSSNGIMHVSGSPIDGVRRYAVFGESNWNHIQIHTAVDPEGGTAGVAVGVAGLPSITRAVMALVDERFGTLRLIERHDGILNDLDSKPLPAGANAPYMLEVFAFDDRLRARVGETVVEAQRSDVREGRLALVAQDGGAFTSLVVESLDAYRFDFQSSCYVNFEEHIGSSSGEVTAIPADAAGPGAATETVASLLTATASEITTVMDSGADPEERQRLFDRWVGGLALPLRHHIAKLELSRLVKAGGIELLLLESPEPLPFSEDVTLTLMRRTFIITPPPIFPQIPRELIELAAGLDFFADSVAGRINPGIITQMIKELRWLVRSEKVDGGLEYHVYDIRLKPGHQGSIQLSGKVVEIVCQSSREGREASPLIKRLAGMQEKEIALMDNTGKLIISNFIPTWSVKYIAVPISILTNGRETQALIIPVDAAMNIHTPLTGGTYRFDFKLDRARFRTQTPDGTSNYRAQTSIITRW